MAKGYWIAHVHVTDPEEYKKYVSGAREAFVAHGATFLARGGQDTEAEGALGRERHVVIEFPSYQAALDCYNSAEYQAARDFRAEAGVATIVLVEGKLNPMSVTIYHNPKCGTSRKVLSILREKGIEPQVIEYLVAPPDNAALTTLLTRMGVGPRAVLRRRGTPYDELDLDDPKWRDDELIGFIAEHPILTERPVVVTEKGAKICRPAEVVNTLI